MLFYFDEFVFQISDRSHLFEGMHNEVFLCLYVLGLKYGGSIYDEIGKYWVDTLPSLNNLNYPLSADFHGITTTNEVFDCLESLSENIETLFEMLHQIDTNSLLPEGYSFSFSLIICQNFDD